MRKRVKSLTSMPMLAMLAAAAIVLLFVGLVVFIASYGGLSFGGLAGPFERIQVFIASYGGLSFGASHPLKKAKPGDWIRYDVAMSADRGQIQGGTLYEVVSNDRKRIKLRMTNGMNVHKEVKEEEIDLSLSSQEIARYFLERGMPDDINKDTIKIEKGKKTKETVLLAGQKFNCAATAFTLTATGLKGQSVMVTGKDWVSKTAPFTGFVKSEMDIIMGTKEKTTKLTLTMTLGAFGNDPQ